MRLELSQAVVQCHVLKLELEPSGLTESVFPGVERWLQQDSDRQRALAFIAGGDTMERYKSVMDFLFCETYPEWQQRCFDWYEEREGSDQLLNQSTPRERAAWGRHLYVVVKVAYEAYCDERRQSWGWVVEEARRRVA